MLRLGRRLWEEGEKNEWKSGAKKMIIPRPCRYVDNVGVGRQRGDAGMEVEADGVLPEVVLVIKAVGRRRELVV